MTLTKAIEIAGANVKARPPGCNADYFDALKLLTEAGKRILRQRLLTIPVNQPPLPGEDMV